MTQLPPESSTGLTKGIRRWDLVAMGINIVIGAGIFGLPSRIYALAGPLSPLAYLVCSIAVLLILFCFAEIGSRFTDTGGPYLYVREAFGPWLGFQVGWLRWLSGSVTFAANSNLLVDYAAFVFPSLGHGTSKSIAVSGVIALIAIVNIVGVRKAAVASNLLAVGKLVPLLLFVGVGAFYFDARNATSGSLPTYGDFSASVVLVMYAFMGFEAITVPAREARDPQRDIPFALFVSMAFIAVLYIAIQMACIGTLPSLATSTRPIADASEHFMGAVGASVIAIGAVLSIAGHLNVQMLSTPRLLFAMAEHNQLPDGLRSLHPKFNTPYFAIAVTTAIILTLALSGTFIQLATLGVVTRLIVFASTCAALPVLRRKKIVRETVELRFGTVIAVASVALCVWMLSNCTAKEYATVAIASLVGFVICFAFKRPVRNGQE